LAAVVVFARRDSGTMNALGTIIDDDQNRPHALILRPSSALTRASSVISAILAFSPWSTPNSDKPLRSRRLVRRWRRAAKPKCRRRAKSGLAPAVMGGDLRADDFAAGISVIGRPAKRQFGFNWQYT